MSDGVVIGKGVVQVAADTKPLDRGIRTLPGKVSTGVNQAARKASAPFVSASKLIVDSYATTGRLIGQKLSAAFNKAAAPAAKFAEKVAGTYGLAGASSAQRLGDAFSVVASRIGKTLSPIGGIIGKVATQVTQGLVSALGAAAKVIGELAGSAVQAFGGIASAAASVLPGVGSVLGAVVSGFTSLVSSMVRGAAAVFSGFISVVTSAVSTVVRVATSLVEGAVSALSHLFKAVSATLVKLGAAASVVGGVIGFTLYKAVHAASDLNETLSKVGVVFGASAGKVDAASKQMERSLGIPRRQFLDAASSIGLIAKSADLSKEASADLSVRLGKLAADAASFYNVPLEEALAAMRSGLVGESEPLRRFGVLLDEDTVKAEALRLGIARGTKELTQAQKVQARAALIIAGMTDASGDLIRTSDALANRMREVGGRVQALMEHIGEIFLPAGKAIAGGLARATQGITEWVDRNKATFAKFAGYLESVGHLIGNVFDNWGGVLTAAEAVFKDLVANARAAFAGLATAIGSALKAAVPVLKAFGSLLATVLKQLFQRAGAALAKVAPSIGKQIAEGLKKGMIAGLGAGGMAAKFLFGGNTPSKDKTGAGYGWVKGFAPRATTPDADSMEGRRRAVELAKAELANLTERKQQGIPGMDPRIARAQEALAESEDRLREATHPAAYALEELTGNMKGFTGALKGLFGAGLNLPGFSAGTKKAVAKVTQAPVKPGAPIPLTAREQLAEDNKRIGAPEFMGTEGQAQKILRERARANQRRNSRQTRLFTRKYAQEARLRAGMTPKQLKARDEQQALEENKLRAVMTPAQIKARDQAQAAARSSLGRGRMAAPTQREAFKAEFIGLEELSKRIQVGALGGGKEDYAKKTADASQTSATALSEMKMNGVKIQGGLPNVVQGPE